MLVMVTVLHFLHSQTPLQVKSPRSCKVGCLDFFWGLSFSQKNKVGGVPRRGGGGGGIL